MEKQSGSFRGLGQLHNYLTCWDLLMHFTNSKSGDEGGQQYMRILRMGEWTIYRIYIYFFTLKPWSALWEC